MSDHEKRMEGLTALLQRAIVLQEAIYWQQVYRQTHPLPRHEMSATMKWLTLDLPPIAPLTEGIYKAGKRAAA